MPWDAEIDERDLASVSDEDFNAYIMKRFVALFYQSSEALEPAEAFEDLQIAEEEASGFSACDFAAYEEFADGDFDPRDLAASETPFDRFATPPAGFQDAGFAEATADQPLFADEIDGFLGFDEAAFPDWSYGQESSASFLYYGGPNAAQPQDDAVEFFAPEPEALADDADAIAYSALMDALAALQQAGAADLAGYPFAGFEQAFAELTAMALPPGDYIF